MAKEQSKEQKKVPTSLAELKGADFNPRSITPEALRGLENSLFVFGDLSGFVWNENTDNIICGHQRQKAMEGIDLSDIDWGEPYEVELGTKEKRFKSKEQLGTFSTKNGAKFIVRRVNWDQPFENGANVMANDLRIQGVFDDMKLGPILEDVEKQLPDMFNEFNLTNIGIGKIEIGDSEPAQEDAEDIKIIENKVIPPPVMAWVLIGIPTIRFGEIASTVEALAKIDGLICEVTANNG